MDLVKKLSHIIDIELAILCGLATGYLIEEFRKLTFFDTLGLGTGSFIRGNLKITANSSPLITSKIFVCGFFLMLQ